MGAEVGVRVRHLAGADEHVYRYTSGAAYMRDGEPTDSPWQAGRTAPDLRDLSRQAEWAEMKPREDDQANTLTVSIVIDQPGATDDHFHLSSETTTPTGRRCGTARRRNAIGRSQGARGSRVPSAKKTYTLSTQRAKDSRQNDLQEPAYTGPDQGRDAGRRPPATAMRASTASRRRRRPTLPRTRRRWPASPSRIRSCRPWPIPSPRKPMTPPPSFFSRSFRFVEWKFVIATPATSTPFCDPRRHTVPGGTRDRSPQVDLRLPQQSRTRAICRRLRANDGRQERRHGSGAAREKMIGQGDPEPLGKTMCLPRRRFGNPLVYRFFASRVRLRRRRSRS